MIRRGKLFHSSMVRERKQYLKESSLVRGIILVAIDYLILVALAIDDTVV